MVTLNFDLEDFKDKAENYTGTQGNSQYGHNVIVFTNAGGYLSMAVAEDIRFGTLIDFKRESFNYDFIKNREMLLEDIFLEGLDIDSVIKAYIKEMKYPVTEEMLEIGVKEAVASNIFSFDEYGIYVHFNPEGADLESYQKWVSIPFEEFGIENIRLFN